MTNRIDRLERRGYVSRRMDQEDRRAVRVGLTADGIRCIDQAVLHRLEAANERLKSLSEQDREALAELLRKLASGN